MKVPIAWLQLRKDRWRFVVAIGGVAFAVMLVFLQLGFRDALFDSAVRLHGLFRYDLAMISVRTPTFIYPAAIRRERVEQARGFEGVRSTACINLGYGRWRNPAQPEITRGIYMIGVDPAVGGLALPAVEASLHQLTRRNACIFDELSRPEFGPVPQLVRDEGACTIELSNRQLDVLGTYQMGTSFGIDGSIVVSDLNFYRYEPETARNMAQVGLIELEPGADPVAVRDRLTTSLPSDVRVLTRAQLIEHELAYWDSATPIGFVFGLGAIVGLIVGAIIVYQILFAGVTDHLRDYATLKAIGYSNTSLSGIVIRQALLLAVAGFLPGALVAVVLYGGVHAATRLPMGMTLDRGTLVLGLTLVTCIASALLAQRKARHVDPAELFA